MQFSYSQDLTLKIWPGQVPGAVDNPSCQEDIQKNKNGNLQISKVSDPTLDVYLAPGDNSSHAAVVICPGGGYGNLSASHEGSDVANWLNENGITGLVLKYRLPSDDIMEDKSIGPLQDVQEAIRITRRQAEEWSIDPGRIGIIGFSAGGHLASTASTHFDEKTYDSDGTSARPDFSILIYPVISMDKEITHMGSRTNLLGEQPSPEKVKHYSNESRVGGDTPPAFIVHSMDDGVVPSENSIRYVQSLKKQNIPVELHLYESGGHGYGLGRGNGTETLWPDACINWLKMTGILD